MRYGYTRTADADSQHSNGQRDALIKAGVGPEHIFNDCSPSGEPLATRPGWSELNARLQAGDEIYVWAFDRLSRSLDDIVDALQDFKAREITFRSLERDVPPSTENRDSLAKLLAASQKVASRDGSQHDAH